MNNKETKQDLEKILYENYTPIKGLGADEIDQAIVKILSLFPDKDAIAKRLAGEKKSEKYNVVDEGIICFNQAIDLAIKIIKGE